MRQGLEQTRDTTGDSLYQETQQEGAGHGQGLCIYIFFKKKKAYLEVSAANDACAGWTCDPTRGLV